MSLTPEERECLTPEERNLSLAVETMIQAFPATSKRLSGSISAALADLARTRLALKQEREDHERTAWAMRDRKPLPSLRITMHGDWMLDMNHDFRCWLGAARAPVWTPEARAAVDKARGEATIDQKGTGT